MSLAGFFDLNLVQQRFPSSSVSEYGIDEVESLIEYKPRNMSQLGLVIWHQIVTRDLYKVDPQEMGRYVESPLFYKKIEEKFKRSFLKDIWVAEVEVREDELDDQTCAEISVAWTHPNDLVLIDVNFQDPYHPIPRKKRRYEHQTHKGLGFMDDFMSALEVKAKSLNCDHILLTAASRDLVPLFKKYGFDLDGSYASKIAYQVGIGIPMSKPL